MKTPISKVKRSGVCYLMTPVMHVNATRSANLDTLGAGIVVGLLIGIVGLMRMILTA